jgi:signal peptidase II
MNLLRNDKLLSVITILFFVIDRLSKIWALTLSSALPIYETQNMNFSFIPEIYFRLVFNRGMSWGILNSETSWLFIFVTLLICGITLWLLQYTISKYQSGLSIFPECLVLLGSLSNIFDRFMYQGVIDFIVVDFGSWIFPIFNLADCAIVFGVFLIFLNLLLEDYFVGNDNV